MHFLYFWKFSLDCLQPQTRLTIVNKQTWVAAIGQAWYADTEKKNCSLFLGSFEKPLQVKSIFPLRRRGFGLKLNTLLLWRAFARCCVHVTFAERGVLCYWNPSAWISQVRLHRLSLGVAVWIWKGWLWSCFTSALQHPPWTALTHVDNSAVLCISLYRF